MSDEPGPEPRKRKTKPKQSKPGSPSKSPLKPGRLLFCPCMLLSLPLVLHALHKQLTHATAVLVTRAHAVKQCTVCIARQQHPGKPSCVMWQEH